MLSEILSDSALQASKPAGIALHALLAACHCVTLFQITKDRVSMA